MLHLSVGIPYEHTKPIPRPDPVHNYEETLDQVLKTRLEEKAKGKDEKTKNVIKKITE